MQETKNSLSILLLGLMCAWLLACTPAISFKPDQKTDLDPDVRRAFALTEEGQYQLAAELYSQLASRHTGMQASHFLLLAADSHLSAGNQQHVIQLLDQLDVAILSPDDDLLRRLIHAEILLAETRGADALSYLTPAPGEDMQNQLMKRYFKVSANAYGLAGNLLERANALQKLDFLTQDSAEKIAVQESIIRTLLTMSPQALRLLQPSPPGVQGGWMELTLILKEFGTEPKALFLKLREWKNNNPDHPVLSELLDSYTKTAIAYYQKADHIAVLLPESGSHASAANMIRDGILAAWLASDANTRPSLRFYDSSNPDASWPTITRAVAEGAEMVIGPLNKEAVRQLARAGELPVPILALNQVVLDTRPPVSLYQYSLSPEDEARQAAERAWIDGRRRPVLLVPEGDWGQRIADAYESAWIGLGGRLAGTGRYDPEGFDYGNPIRSLFHLGQSEGRHRRLQGILGQKLMFDPRRREDVDSIFIAARPQQARQIRPQLQFHHAADLPVYATSHAWNGYLDKREALDLVGLQIPDIPWFLADETGDLSYKNIVQDFPSVRGSYGRLYAMGMDAYRLAPHLSRLASNSLESVDGQTGSLYMDGSQHVRRQLVWAKLGERVEVLGYSPRLDQMQGGSSLNQGISPILNDLPMPVSQPAG